MQPSAAALTRLRNAIVAAMEDEGITSYRELSRRTDGGVSHSAVATLMSGHTKAPRTDKLWALEKVLRFDRDELVRIRDGG